MFDIDPGLKNFMNNVFSAREIVGLGKIVDRRVGYGSLPDVQLTVERKDGEFDFVSAKEMYRNGVAFK